MWGASWGGLTLSQLLQYSSYVGVGVLHCSHQVQHHPQLCSTSWSVGTQVKDARFSFILGVPTAKGVLQAVD